MSMLDFYRQQSPITDPGEFAWMYDALPDDIAELYLVAQRRSSRKTCRWKWSSSFQRGNDKW